MKEEKRVLLVRVPDKCKYLSVTDSGNYCTACINYDGWELIPAHACNKCKYKEHYQGITVKETTEVMALALAEFDKYIIDTGKIAKMGHIEYYREAARFIFSRMLRHQCSEM